MKKEIQSVRYIGFTALREVGYLQVALLYQASRLRVRNRLRSSGAVVAFAFLEKRRVTHCN
jgi:hypothetical protein